jgi:hypothetical protein
MMVGFTSDHRSHIDAMILSGRGRTHVLENLHGRASAIALHRNMRRIFWSDDLNGEIESAELTGGTRYRWRAMQYEPVSLAVLGPNVYFTSSHSPFLFWADGNDDSERISKIRLGWYNIILI